jgi:hypothetical protein
MFLETPDCAGCVAEDRLARPAISPFSTSFPLSARVWHHASADCRREALARLGGWAYCRGIFMVTIGSNGGLVERVSSPRQFRQDVRDGRRVW